MNIRCALVVASGLVAAVLLSATSTIAQDPQSYDRQFDSADSSCEYGGGPVKGLAFHCRHMFANHDGTSAAKSWDDDFLLYPQPTKYKFCGYHAGARDQEPPHGGAYVRVLMDPQYNTVRVHEHTAGQGSKVWAHIYVRWIDLEKSDKTAVTDFKCIGGAWTDNANLIWGDDPGPYHGPIPARSAHCTSVTTSDGKVSTTNPCANAGVH